jgi:hypothetical protein
VSLKPHLSFFFIVVIAAGLLGQASAVGAQNSTERYFPHTGHSVTGDFLVTYESVSDPIKIYGEPITEAFFKPELNQQLQYFQKAVFALELNPSTTQHVEIYPLGWLLPHPEFQHGANLPGCQYFTETGFQVCYTFLDFFKEFGGVAQFGFPISDFEMESGRIVQYFQRSRFEWHPELPFGQKVVLSDLGSEYFRYIGENPRYLLPESSNNVPQKVILSIHVRVFTGVPVIPQRGEQTLYVLVQDQNQQPVENVSLQGSLQLPGGQRVELDLAKTNQNGITVLVLPVDAHDHGIAQVFVRATFSSFQDTNQTSFWIWW